LRCGELFLPSFNTQPPEGGCLMFHFVPFSF